MREGSTGIDIGIIHPYHGYRNFFSATAVIPKELAKVTEEAAKNKSVQPPNQIRNTAFNVDIKSKILQAEV